MDVYGSMYFSVIETEVYPTYREIKQHVRCIHFVLPLGRETTVQHLSRAESGLGYDITMPRRYPIKWKMLRVSEDTHSVLEDLKRPRESYSQAITRLLLFYSHMLYDMEKDEWDPSESSVCQKPVDMSSCGVDE